jgi:hypothetical protein
VTQTFKEKLAELEAKRRAEQEALIVAELETSEFPETSDAPQASEDIASHSDRHFDKVASVEINSKPKISALTLTIFVSLFVIVLAQAYVLLGSRLTHQVTQKSLDQTFTYKGGLADGLFSGKATVTDKAGNVLTAKFEAGKMVGAVTYTKKNTYEVTQNANQTTTITLPNQTQVTQKGNQYVLKSANFAYDGAWRFAGTWQGKMQFSNKAAYSGTWKNGLPEGQGVYTTIDGEPIEGTFKFGVPEE